MKHVPTIRTIARVAAAALACVWIGFPAAASVVEQTFQLDPGWNAIWLEVQPEPNDIEIVFAGVPVVSVWTWESGTSRVQFLRDPSEGLLNRPGWLGYFPPGPEHFLTNLHTLQAHRAYMVRLPHDAPPVALTVTGRPSLRPIRWTPNSYNLVGFPVDPDAPPTFGDFLAPSPAHAGQPVYRLVAGGRWEQVAGLQAQHIRPGEAYWVYTHGASSYTAPIEVEIDGGDGLEFADLLVERRVRIRRPGGGGGTVTIRTRPSGNSLPLCYWDLQTVTDPESGRDYPRVAWPDLGAEHAVDLSDAGKAVLRVAVRRARLAADRAEGYLEIRDGAGTRLLVPVGVGSSSTAKVGINQHAREGLWVGTAVVAEVSEPYAGPPEEPTPTPAAFSFRLIVHVDGSGTPRLLTQVFQMWQWADPPTNTSGHYVLVTDDDKLPDYEPASLRDGDPVSYRISAVAYDFDNDDAAHENALQGTGAFDPDDTVTFTLNLGATAPTNPFLHRFHPDHDDDHQAADIDYDPDDPDGVRGGVYDIARNWTLNLASTDPENEVAPPAWGDTLVGGTFEETLTGLHKDEIALSGRFRLWRVSRNGTLNP